ncbi:MAG TPA: anti-sigma factor [Xanthobacteraceae bacterium]|jgi:anti-sigma factor RsiW
MTDREPPVTEDELHAYVDGEIAADRRGAVEAWLAAHPEDAARVAQWQAQAEAIRQRYGAVALEPVPTRFDLDALARGRRSWTAIAAAAVLLAFLVGGVVGWMAHGAAAAAPSRFDVFTSQALDAYRVYVVEVRHPVEVTGAERPHLVQWLSKRLDYELRIPDLQASGLRLVGGRLLPGPFGPAAFIMYEGASGERFTIYYARTDSPQTAMRYREAERFAALYWVERGLAYVVTGPSDRDRLFSVAQAAYDRIDKDVPQARP